MLYPSFCQATRDMYPVIQNNVMDINSLPACVYMEQQLWRHKRNKPVSEFVDNNFALDRKIREALTGVLPSVQWSLQELPRAEDKELVADFILTYPNESEDGMPMSANTKRAYISALVYLARYHEHKKILQGNDKIGYCRRISAQLEERLLC
jgi:hypothetical protein